jgi:hypothetical protein
MLQAIRGKKKFAKTAEIIKAEKENNQIFVVKNATK